VGDTFDELWIFPGSSFFGVNPAIRPFRQDLSQRCVELFAEKPGVLVE
jgi:hypothetical protein